MLHNNWHDKNTIPSLEGLLLIWLKAQLQPPRVGVHSLCLMWSRGFTSTSPKPLPIHPGHGGESANPASGACGYSSPCQTQPELMLQHSCSAGFPCGYTLLPQPWLPLLRPEINWTIVPPLSYVKFPSGTLSHSSVSQIQAGWASCSFFRDFAIVGKVL